MNKVSPSLLPSHRRGLALSVLGISAALHGALAVLAGLWIVARNTKSTRENIALLPSLQTKREPTTDHPPTAYPSPFEILNATSYFNDQIQSIRPAPLSLPSLPKITAPLIRPSESPFNTALLSHSVASATQGLDAFHHAGGLGEQGAGIKFLGIQTHSKRIVLMFDVSKTVVHAAAKTAVPMERIREQTADLIQGLGVNTRFGIVEFARNYAFFHPHLLPTTVHNRTAALEWLAKHFATEGTLSHKVPNLVEGSPGFLVALEAVFQMQPDSIFVISDGNMQRGKGVSTNIPLSELEEALAHLQATQKQKAKLFFIGVGVHPDTEKAIRRILSVHGGGGTYSELKK